MVERETIKEDGTVVRRCVSGERHGVTPCVLCNNSYTQWFSLFNNTLTLVQIHLIQCIYFIIELARFALKVLSV